MEDLPGNAGFGGANMDSLQTMGILNALKTGNVMVDMIIAMTIPIIIKFLFDSTGNVELLFLKFLGFFKARYEFKKDHKRSIVHKTDSGNRLGNNGHGELDSKNAILIKAVQLYVHCNLHLDLPEADVELLETFDKHRDKNNNNNTALGVLSRYNIVRKPVCNKWIDLGEFGKDDNCGLVKLKIIVEESEEQDPNSGSGSSKTITNTKRHFEFKSEVGGAIDAFLHVAYNWYLDELKKLQDNTRYLYEMQTSSGWTRDDDDDCKYKRYKLSEEKTFKSLFFPEKENIMKLLDNFLERRGKYAVEGYPHKLGLLLHGPPGTGKTSLIKALAQATGRSIVNVPLSRISSNAELQSIMFDRNYHIEGEYMRLTMEYKDVIFVMEDVDAACDIVKRRDGKKGNKAAFQASKKKGAGRGDNGNGDEDGSRTGLSMWQMLLASRENSCKELVKKLVEKSERLKEEAAKSEMLLNTTRRMMSVPGLSFVAEATNSKDPKLRRLGESAVETAGEMMNSCSSIESFLAMHAETLTNLLDAGAAVDEAFVSALLDDTMDSESNNTSVSTLDSMFESDSDDEDGDVGVRGGGKGLQQKGGSDVGAATATAAAMAGLAQMLSQQQKKSNSNSSEEGPQQGPSAWSKLLDEDKLTLSGLLNVLDGVVDCPGRMVIMTTNHPEHLDPALIRPGRIDKTLLLGYMEPECVVQMVEHYFQCTLSVDQKDRVIRALEMKSKRGVKLQLTPAVVEQLAAEHELVEDLVQALEGMVGLTEQ